MHLLSHRGVVLRVPLEVLEADVGEGMHREFVELGPGGYGRLGRCVLSLLDKAGEDVVGLHLLEA